MSDLKDKTDKFVALLMKEVPRINEGLALNAYALIKDRIQNEGLTGESYSTNEIPLFFRKGGKTIAPFSNAKNKAGENFFLKKVKTNAKLPKNEQEGISYKEWREANNLQSNHVDLKFTGETWKDIGVVKTIVSHDKITTTVGAKNTKVRKYGTTTSEVLEGLGDRYGNFLQPTKEQEEMLTKALEQKITNLINKSFK